MPNLQDFGRDISGENCVIIHHKVSARAVCILSSDDAFAASQAEHRNITGIGELFSRRVPGKRRGNYLEDQVTAFKCARMLAREDTSPLDSYGNVTESSSIFSGRVSSASSYTTIDEVSEDVGPPLHEEHTAGAVVNDISYSLCFFPHLSTSGRIQSPRRRLSRCGRQQ